MTRRSSAAVLALLLAAVAGAQTPPPTADEQKALELFRAGRPDAAFAALKDAAKANPLLPPAKVLFADFFVRSGNGGRGRQLLEEAAAEDPGHPDVFLKNGSYALAEGRTTDAVLSFEAALKAADSPRWAAAQQKRMVREARLGLAAGYRGRRDYKAARGQLTAALADDPKNGPLRAEAAAAAFLSGDAALAETELKAAFADDPTLDPPELSLALLWDGKRDATQAEGWFKKGTAAHPKSVKMARGYARWLIDRGRAADAGPALEALAALDPASTETQFVLGMAARYRKDFASAEKVFDGLLREAPGNPIFGLNLAIALAEAEDPRKRDRAVQQAEAVQRQFPREPECAAVLGWCLLRAGRADEAAAQLQARINAGPLNPDSAYYVSRLMDVKGQGAEAAKLLRQAVGDTGPFVYRKDAEALLAELEKRFPPPKEMPAEKK